MKFPKIQLSRNISLVLIPLNKMSVSPFFHCIVLCFCFFMVSNYQQKTVFIKTGRISIKISTIPVMPTHDVMQCLPMIWTRVNVAAAAQWSYFHQVFGVNLKEKKGRERVCKKEET